MSTKEDNFHKQRVAALFAGGLVQVYHGGMNRPRLKLRLNYINHVPHMLNLIRNSRLQKLGTARGT